MKPLINFSLSVLAVSTVLTSPVSFQGLNNNKFAASIYKQISFENEENILVSPLSAQFILAVSQLGAKGETLSELQSVVNFPLQSTISSDDDDYSLKAINKIYIKQNFSIHEEFAKLTQTFGSQVENLDFEKKTEAAAQINRWVENETNNRIHDLLNPNLLTNETRLVLLNALHLRGNWSIPFNFLATNKNNFFLNDQDAVNVDTMNVFGEHFQFYEKQDLNATFLELPIVGANISMTVVLPYENNLEQLESNMEKVFEEPKEKLYEMFDVSLPKFNIESSIDFKKVLRKLGVSQAFQDGKADFTGIAGKKGQLFISEIVQKTFIDVNEDGLEAAAATFIVKIINRNGGTPRQFNANKPFLFFVKKDDLILFVGRVKKPNY